MATLDIIIRDLLWKHCILIILIFAILYVLIGKKFKEIRERFLVKQMKRFSKEYDRKMEGLKEELFEDLNELESGVIELKNRGVLRILEIGVGAGKNLKYYPQQCQFIVADPNNYFKQHFIENKSKKFPDIFLEKYLETRAEDLGGIETESVDVVVTTVVLCSVSDVKRVLHEIRRVLVPGGRFYFIEHIADFSGTRKYKIQRFLSSVTGIWPSFCGCWLDRRIDDEIASLRWSSLELRRIRIESDGSKLFQLIEPHVLGVGIK